MTFSNIRPVSGLVMVVERRSTTGEDGLCDFFFGGGRESDCSFHFYLKTVTFTLNMMGDSDNYGNVASKKILLEGTTTPTTQRGKRTQARCWSTTATSTQPSSA